MQELKQINLVDAIGKTISNVAVSSSKEYEKEVSGHHYDNPFKERTDDQPN